MASDRMDVHLGHVSFYYITVDYTDAPVPLGRLSSIYEPGP